MYKTANITSKFRILVFCSNAWLLMPRLHNVQHVHNIPKAGGGILKVWGPMKNIRYAQKTLKDPQNVQRAWTWWSIASARADEKIYHEKKNNNKKITVFWKGVNVVEYCKCEGFTDCSTQWDPYDGKSITQAQSDQYKVGIFTCCKRIEIISKRRRNCWRKLCS